MIANINENSFSSECQSSSVVWRTSERTENGRSKTGGDEWN